MPRQCSLLQTLFVTAALLMPTGRASAQSPQVLADFTSTTARFPAAALLLGSDGSYYGTTYLGGEFNLGTIFRLTLQDNGPATTVLHSFDGSDGANPYAPLVEGSDGNLYGTTLPQASGNGTVFRITKQGQFTLIHTLPPPDSNQGGCYPEGSGFYAPLVGGSDGLYGVAAAADCTAGIPFFKVTYTGVFSVVGHVGGASTTSGLTRGSDGNFYGMTDCCDGFGTIYRISQAGVFQRLRVLTRFDGFAHTGELVQASNGKFYGTARAGGAYSGTFDGGTVFEFTPGADEASSTYTVLYSFGENDPAGSEPYAGLVEGADGRLYGTTIRTGANRTSAGGGGGVVFSVSKTGALSALFPLDATTGYQPMGELIQPTSGTFVGTAAFGGSTQNLGTVFRFAVAGATTTTLRSSHSSSVWGEIVTLTATVAASGSPGGNVEFFDGQTSVGTAPLNGATATFAIGALGIGTHTLSARYLGDGGFLGSVASAVSLTVGRAQTAMTLQAVPNPSQRKQTVTITATVTPVAPGAGIPTGSVQLMEGKKRIGTATLVNGMAVFQASFTGMGEQVLTATYPGESPFFGSSSTLTQVLTR